jgi:hypothetical protein
MEGRMMGLEPTSGGTTNLFSTDLAITSNSLLATL